MQKLNLVLLSAITFLLLGCDSIETPIDAQSQAVTEPDPITLFVAKELITMSDAAGGAANAVAVQKWQDS